MDCKAAGAELFRQKSWISPHASDGAYVFHSIPSKLVKVALGKGALRLHIQTEA